MADRYWVGGGSSASWNATANTNWGTASNTQDNASVPTVNDDVFFDGVGTGASDCTATGNHYAKSINFTGYANALNSNSYVDWHIVGNLTLSTGMTENSIWRGDTWWYFSGASTITCNGKYIGGNVVFEDSSNVTLADTLIVGLNDIEHNANRGTLTLEAGGTFNHGNQEVIIRGNDPWINGAFTFYNLNRETGGQSIYGDIGRDLSLYSDITVINELKLQGYSLTHRLLVKSNTPGIHRHITNSGATMTLSNVDFQDIYLNTAYDASAITGGCGNCGGNTNITCTTADDWYWNGSGSRNFSDYTYWYTATNGGGTQMGSTRIPLPQDTCYINADSIDGATTISQDLARIPGLDCTASGVFTLNISVPQSIYGSFILNNNISYSGNSGTNFFGRGAYNLDTQGREFGDTGIYALGGSVTLLSNFNPLGYNRSLGVVDGTFDANDFNVSTNYLSVESSTRTRQINMGSGDWDVHGYMYFRTVTNFTLNAETSTITYSGNSDMLLSNGVNFYDVVLNNVARCRPGTSTWHDLTLVAGSTNKFEATYTVLTINSLTGEGTSGNMITINTENGTGSFTLIDTDGTNTIDYCNIYNSTVQGGATWNADVNCYDGGGNTGWFFGSSSSSSSSVSSSSTSRSSSSRSSSSCSSSSWSYDGGLPYSDDFNDNSKNPSWIDFVKSGITTYGAVEQNSRLEMNVTCGDMWSGSDEYITRYLPDISGDFEAIVKIVSSSGGSSWSKFGILTKINMEAPGSSLGECMVAATNGNGYALQWDSDGNGCCDGNINTGSFATNSYVRMRKIGSTIYGHYSTNGTSWTSIGSCTPSGITTIQDVGIFVCGNGGANSAVNFDDFSIETYSSVSSSSESSHSSSSSSSSSKDPAITWLGDWIYRKSITVTGQSGAGTNYQVKLLIGATSSATGENLDLEGHSLDFPSAKNDSGDIRFTESDGVTELDFWVESVSGSGDSALATVWVEVSNDLGSNVNIYCYYGKSGAINVSNGDNTFLFFDDFNGASLDTSKWSILNSGNGTDTEATSEHTITSSGDWWNTNDDSRILISKTQITGSYSFDALINDAGSAGYNRYMGLRHHPSNTNCSMICQLSDSDQSHLTSAYRTSDGGGSTYQGDDIKAFSEPFISRLTRIGTTNSAWYASDGSAYSTQTISDLDYPAITSTAGGTSKFDWVRVRKYIYTEPSFGSVGSETSNSSSSSSSCKSSSSSSNFSSSSSSSLSSSSSSSCRSSSSSSSISSSSSSCRSSSSSSSSSISSSSSSCRSSSSSSCRSSSSSKSSSSSSCRSSSSSSSISSSSSSCRSSSSSSSFSSSSSSCRSSSSSLSSSSSSCKSSSSSSSSSCRSSSSSSSSSSLSSSSSSCKSSSSSSSSSCKSSSSSSSSFSSSSSCRSSSSSSSSSCRSSSSSSSSSSNSSSSSSCRSSSSSSSSSCKSSSSSSSCRSSSSSSSSSSISSSSSSCRSSSSSSSSSCRSSSSSSSSRSSSSSSSSSSLSSSSSSCRSSSSSSSSSCRSSSSSSSSLSSSSSSSLSSSSSSCRSSSSSSSISSSSSSCRSSSSSSSSSNSSSSSSCRSSSSSSSSLSSSSSSCKSSSSSSSLSSSSSSSCRSSSSSSSSSSKSSSSSSSSISSSSSSSCKSSSSSSSSSCKSSSSSSSNSSSSSSSKSSSSSSSKSSSSSSSLSSSSSSSRSSSSSSSSSISSSSSSCRSSSSSSSSCRSSSSSYSSSSSSSCRSSSSSSSSSCKSSSSSSSSSCRSSSSSSSSISSSSSKSSSSSSSKSSSSSSLSSSSSSSSSNKSSSSSSRSSSSSSSSCNSSSSSCRSSSSSSSNSSSSSSSKSSSSSSSSISSSSSSSLSSSSSSCKSSSSSSSSSCKSSSSSSSISSSSSSSKSSSSSSNSSSSSSSCRSSSSSKSSSSSSCKSSSSSSSLSSSSSSCKSSSSSSSYSSSSSSSSKFSSSSSSSFSLSSSSSFSSSSSSSFSSSSSCKSSSSSSSYSSSSSSSKSSSSSSCKSSSSSSCKSSSSSSSFSSSSSCKSSSSSSSSSSKSSSSSSSSISSSSSSSSSSLSSSSSKSSSSSSSSSSLSSSSSSKSSSSSSSISSSSSSCKSSSSSSSFSSSSSSCRSSSSSSSSSSISSSSSSSSSKSISSSSSSSSSLSYSSFAIGKIVIIKVRDYVSQNIGIIRQR